MSTLATFAVHKDEVSEMDALTTSAISHSAHSVTFRCKCWSGQRYQSVRNAAARNDSGISHFPFCGLWKAEVDDTPPNKPVQQSSAFWGHSSQKARHGAWASTRAADVWCSFLGCRPSRHPPEYGTFFDRSNKVISAMHIYNPHRCLWSKWLLWNMASGSKHLTMHIYIYNQARWPYR